VILEGAGHTSGPWLTWHDDPKTTICISWLTAEKKDTRVYYGKDPDNLNRTASGKDDVYLHKLYIEDLTPGSKYYYRIDEAFETRHRSDLFSFRTAPDVEQPFEFIVFGDMQPKQDITEKINRLFIEELLKVSEKNPFDFIIQLGDLTETGEDVKAWHRVLNNLSRISALHPTMSVIGNHEWGSKGNAAVPGDTGSSFTALFSYPYENPKQGRYYSFNYLNALFIAVDPFEHYYHMSNTQLSWLENVLKRARASSDIDWIFVLMHPSILSTGSTPIYFEIQEKLIPLFDRYAVSAVFYGHDHHYEMYSFTYGENGLLFDPSHNWLHNNVKYILTGSAGAPLEIDYSVLMRSPYKYRRKWFGTEDSAFLTKTYTRSPWNESRQTDRVSLKFPVAPGWHTYHLPGEESYQTDIDDFGYVYGEQTMSYVRVRIDGTTCRISAHYPEGDLIKGPYGDLPQLWTLTR
jgi:hypothetical protein